MVKRERVFLCARECVYKKRQTVRRVENDLTAFSLVFWEGGGGDLEEGCII